MGYLSRSTRPRLCPAVDARARPSRLRRLAHRPPVLIHPPPQKPRSIMTGTRAAGRDWLRGHRAALILTFDIDAESCMLSEGRRYAEHPNVMSQQAYGPIVGVLRILDTLNAHPVRATFFVPGVTADPYP